MIVEGAISVKACILQGKRKVERVYIDKNKKTKDFSFILHAAEKRDIPVSYMTREELLTMGPGKTFGGILAEVGERKNDRFDGGDVFYLDGIEDPFNLGYICRTLYAFGVRNVLLPYRDLSVQEGQLLKSSAGAYEMMNVIFSKDTAAELKRLKNSDYTFYALNRSEDSKDIFDTSFHKRALFMLGGEKRGISAELLMLSDHDLYISYAGNFRNALNAAAAADVVATLLYHQRRK